MALDRQVTCTVFEGGFVWPAPELLPPQLAGMLEEVNANGAEPEGAAGPSERPETRQGETPARRDSPEGTAARSPESPLVRNAIPRMTDDFSEALLAYPQFKVSSASGGSWLAGVVQPVADLPITASLATWFPADLKGTVLSWAWWSDGVWIGPRHTYTDASICSFERDDCTWTRRMGARLLLDLNSLWVARQIYLRAHGRWPGMQRIHTPIERLVQQQPDELCGGCASGLRYAGCCRARDLKQVAPDMLRRYSQSGFFDRRRMPDLPALKRG